MFGNNFSAARGALFAFSLPLLTLLCGVTSGLAAGTAQHVIHISVDGLNATIL
jgi:hypothetical protein